LNSGSFALLTLLLLAFLNLLCKRNLFNGLCSSLGLVLVVVKRSLPIVKNSIVLLVVPRSLKGGGGNLGVIVFVV
jgi:hypothetical protein